MPVLILAGLGLVPVGLGWCFVTRQHIWFGYVLSALGAALWAGVEVANNLWPGAVGFADDDGVRPLLDLVGHERRVRAADDDGRALFVYNLCMLAHLVDAERHGRGADQVTGAQGFERQAHQVLVPDFDGDGVGRERGQAHERVGRAVRLAPDAAIALGIDEDDAVDGHVGGIVRDGLGDVKCAG